MVRIRSVGAVGSFSKGYCRKRNIRREGIGAGKYIEPQWSAHTEP